MIIQYVEVLRLWLPNSTAFVAVLRGLHRSFSSSPLTCSTRARVIVGPGLRNGTRHRRSGFPRPKSRSQNWLPLVSHGGQRCGWTRRPSRHKYVNPLPATFRLGIISHSLSLHTLSYHVLLVLSLSPPTLSFAFSSRLCLLSPLCLALPWGNSTARSLRVSLDRLRSSRPQKPNTSPRCPNNSTISWLPGFKSPRTILSTPSTMFSINALTLTRY